MKLIAGAIAAVAVAVAITVPATASAETCSSGYRHAVIGGAQKCLHAGEYCARAEARQYPRYGYLCEDVRGTYRLERER